VHPLPEGQILLAFSGGPDSIGLAARLRPHDPLLAYVDHRQRGAREARRERARVRELARGLGLELVRARVTVARGGEAAARRERYRVLHALARKRGAVAVATAHTADDRAETILLNLLRGRPGRCAYVGWFPAADAVSRAQPLRPDDELSHPAKEVRGRSRSGRRDGRGDRPGR